MKDEKVPTVVLQRLTGRYPLDGSSASLVSVTQVTAAVGGRGIGTGSGRDNHTETHLGIHIQSHTLT